MANQIPSIDSKNENQKAHNAVNAGTDQADTDRLSAERISQGKGARKANRAQQERRDNSEEEIGARPKEAAQSEDPREIGKTKNPRVNQPDEEGPSRG